MSVITQLVEFHFPSNSPEGAPIPAYCLRRDVEPDDVAKLTLDFSTFVPGDVIAIAFKDYDSDGRLLEFAQRKAAAIIDGLGVLTNIIATGQAA